MLEPYLHEGFNQWLSEVTHEGLRVELNHITRLVVNVKNDSSSMDLFLDTLLDNAENGDEEPLEYLDTIIKAFEGILESNIQEYGILLHRDKRPDQYFHKLSLILEGILSLDDYEDVESMQSIMEFTENPEEKFAELISLVKPEIDVFTVLELTQEVLGDFFKRLEASMRPRLNYLKQQDENLEVYALIESRRALEGLKEEKEFTRQFNDNQEKIETFFSYVLPYMSKLNELLLEENPLPRIVENRDKCHKDLYSRYIGKVGNIYDVLYYISALMVELTLKKHPQYKRVEILEQFDYEDNNPMLKFKLASLSMNKKLLKDD